MMAKLIASWRKTWSAVPGTTDPLAPFGLVSLADGTDEGFGINMRQFRWVKLAPSNHLPRGTHLYRRVVEFLSQVGSACPPRHRRSPTSCDSSLPSGGCLVCSRWAQLANYGMAPNPAMPRTFAVDAFDLGDPWHTPLCGNSGPFEGGSYVGYQCCVGEAEPLGAACRGDHRGRWALNGTRDWAGLGTLHPRVKQPVGSRLACVTLLDRSPPSWLLSKRICVRVLKLGSALLSSFCT